jgi:hypothetical protein
MAAPLDWQPLTRRFVATAPRTLEFALEPTRSGLSWEGEQRDALGSYTARYAFVPLAGGELEMTKVKVSRPSPRSRWRFASLMRVHPTERARSSLE